MEGILPDAHERLENCREDDEFNFSKVPRHLDSPRFERGWSEVAFLPVIARPLPTFVHGE